MVPYGPHKWNRSLLPYEKELCELIGCSEEEYETFKKKAADRAGTRPTEYALIPDVQASGVEPALIIALVNLAVGVAAIGVSLLMRPSIPQANEQEATGGRLTTQGRRGRERYSPTQGFDAIADIASYGEAVPLVWAATENVAGEFAGGVLVEPKLVWSRCLSYGTTQQIKMLYVVGLADVGSSDIALPQKQDIYIGNNALSINDDADYAFYFGTASKKNNVTKVPKRYGTEGGNTTGDPPGAEFESFSQSYTPTNNVTFGVYRGIPNGTCYRVNWKTINVFDKIGEEEGPEDARRRNEEERAKICGYTDKMYGVGMMYPRRQGMYNSTQFRIYNLPLADDSFKEDVEVTDINSALDEECFAADDALQVGTRVMIGTDIFKVKYRSEDTWLSREENNNRNMQQVISLERTERISNLAVSPDIPPRRAVENNRPVCKGGQTSSRPVPINGGSFVGTDETPLCLFEDAMLRNTRPCLVTEIGITSRVWNRVGGLTNFQTILAPYQIEDADDENVSITDGQMSLYYRRYSFFTLQIRAAGATKWSAGDIVYTIRGSIPQDQYNSIRINHGSCRALEFRFVPLTSAVVIKRKAKQVYWIDNKFRKDLTLKDGGYTIKIIGKRLTVNDDLLDANIFKNDKTGGSSYKRNFFENSQVSEISYYGSAITRSCDSGPEHRIGYVNEILNNGATYKDLTLAGVSLRSGQSFTSAEQLRVFVRKGSSASHSFAELALRLLDNAAVPGGMDSALIDRGSFADASRYCKEKDLFFDGVLAERFNLRSFISEHCPYFLLDLVTKNGEISLQQSLPDSFTAKQLFSSGNIVSDSLRVEMIDVSARRLTQLNITYRQNRDDDFPTTQTIRVSYGKNSTDPSESLDLSSFCTSHKHAETVGRYILAMRRHMTRTYSFQTYPDQVNFGPGDIIKVALSTTNVQTRSAGAIGDDGVVTSTTPIEDGTHEVSIYKPGGADVEDAVLNIKDGVVTDAAFYGSIFALRSVTLTTDQLKVQEINLNQEGLVDIKAIRFTESIKNETFGKTATVVPSGPDAC